MDQPPNPQGPEQKTQNVPEASGKGPPRIEVKEKGREISKGNLTEEDDEEDACYENRDEKTDHSCASGSRGITWLILNFVM